MDLFSIVSRSALLVLVVVGYAQAAVYTRRICTCNLMSEDESLHLVIEPNTTYEAWPSVHCGHARPMCLEHCHNEMEIAIKAMDNVDGHLYKPHHKDGRRLGYDLCLQYGKSTPDLGVKIVMRAEVEHCSTKDIDPAWETQLCCGFTPSPINGDESKMFGWYPNCPNKNTIIFA